MRPIVPCHSAIQNPAAKYISKKLKPLVQAAPSVLHGTKDMAIKLSKINIDPRRQFFIVTGDVVAFYPNIPLDHCMDIVMQQYEEYMLGNLDITPENADENPDVFKEIQFFHRCMIVGNTNLVLQY